uniref:Putative secreted peptide n=1 Tax=Anopheles braziliensis TaxID=58242 RepID=A0A2M3ZQ41_9DIPT
MFSCTFSSSFSFCISMNDSLYRLAIFRICCSLFFASVSAASLLARLVCISSSLLCASVSRVLSSTFSVVFSAVSAERFFCRLVTFC